jgi:hypothetical protein
MFQIEAVDIGDIGILISRTNLCTVIHILENRFELRGK